LSRKRETKQGREARHGFYEAVLSGSCWFSNKFAHKCDGPIDPCHLLPKQRLKNLASRRGYDEAETLRLVWDARNGVPGCRAIHHKLDNGFIRMYWDQLPDPALEFAREWDLEWEMEQQYRKEQQ
jgi:hypothetical protein